MMDFISTFVPRAVQDTIQAIAGYLLLHGFLAADQVTGFEGSAFFLAMLVINYEISHFRKVNAANAGAITVGGILTPAQAHTIAKTGKPIA